MTTFIQLTEDDAGYFLADILEDVKTKKTGEPAPSATEEKAPSEFHELVETRQYPKLLADGFLPLFDDIAQSGDDVYESATTLAASLLKQFEEEKEIIDFVSEASEKIEAHQSKNAALRLKLLTALYNALPLSTVRLQVFSRICKVALATDNARMVMPLVSNVDSWISQWALEGQDAADLHELAFLVHKAVQPDSPQTESLLRKYLKDTETLEEIPAVALTYATEAVLKLLKRSEVPYVADLAALKAVDALGGPLGGLLHAFSSESVSDLQSVLSGSEAEVRAFGLLPDTLLKKLQTLALCSVAVRANGEKVTYASVQEKLRLANAQEVEEAVITAVVSGLLEARIDQHNQVIVVHRVNKPASTADTWPVLRDKLQQWRNSLTQAMHSLAKSTPTSASTGPAAPAADADA